MVGTPFGWLFAALATACWPVLVWYVRGSLDGSNDPWGLLALVSAALLLWRAPGGTSPKHPLALPTCFLLLYMGATLSGLPLSLRAIFAILSMAALASAWRLGQRLDLPLTILGLLALPLSASLQYYCGYPLRVLAGTLAAALLQLNGLAVFPEGATLLWGTQQIAIDVPCSGVRMLWSGCYLMAAAAALLRFSPRPTLLAAVLTICIVVMANALRAAALFYLETGLIPLPPWAHEATGLLIFIAAGMLIVWSMYRIAEDQTGGPKCWPGPPATSC